ncbi:MAG: hypothetical protein ACRD3G_27670 [Vicinamibacterales bacterium]
MRTFYHKPRGDTHVEVRVKADTTNGLNGTRSADPAVQTQKDAAGA